MATMKITLNELRTLVKQIIKEERMLNEAVNQEINQYNEDGRKQGYWEENVNGEVHKGNYENGKKNGTWEEYAFGKLILMQNWKNGKEDGFFVSYDNKGHLWARGTFRNGKLVNIYRHQNTQDPIDGPL